MCGLKVRFSQSPERRGVFEYAFRAEVISADGIPSKIFVYHQMPAGIDGNTFAEFDHVATPVDFQEIPEDAASETVPWYRTDKCTVWFRCAKDLQTAKQLFVDDIISLQKSYNVLTSVKNFTEQTTVEFSGGQESHAVAPEDGGSIFDEIDEIKDKVSGKLDKDALSGIKIKANTMDGMREAIEEIGRALGADISKPRRK